MNSFVTKPNDSIRLFVTTWLPTPENREYKQSTWIDLSIGQSGPVVCGRIADYGQLVRDMRLLETRAELTSIQKQVCVLLFDKVLEESGLNGVRARINWQAFGYNATERVRHIAGRIEISIVLRRCKKAELAWLEANHILLPATTPLEDFSVLA